jgi:hypothetical protein
MTPQKSKVEREGFVVGYVTIRYALEYRREPLGSWRRTETFLDQG